METEPAYSLTCDISFLYLSYVKKQSRQLNNKTIDHLETRVTEYTRK